MSADRLPTADEIARAIVSLPRVALDDQLWDDAAVAAYLRISVKTMAEVRYRKGFPEPLYPGSNSPRYIAADVIAWAKMQSAKVPKPRKRRQSSNKATSDADAE